MQDFNQNRKGRNLRKYCNDEGIDYKWLPEYKRTYGATKTVASPKAGYMILQKWFDDGKLMKPKFMEMKRFHHITR